MEKGLEIVFKGVEFSGAIDEIIRKKVAKLERCCERISGCRVVVDSPHNRRHKGKTYHVSIEVTVPNGEPIITHSQDENPAHIDAYVAIRDVFLTMRRRLVAMSTRRTRMRNKEYRIEQHLVEGSLDDMIPAA